MIYEKCFSLDSQEFFLIKTLNLDFDHAEWSLVHYPKVDLDKKKY